ncbi:hypothetical protein ymoll0001_35610 [Yersinia mollaretii ATCC 43969]|uniref:Uncharacterized protein n=1 Tax=Yersinia mollaretii (strain ATCC 43969 / DSM 18520 / CIP 103324 / CNY 7263 / WAIP 204) TaxID=349967 RepID=A0ABM9Y8C9_YERMW|nr:hypothetical protein ymoll0001_35610 [Yersinia mollaretii ATCC 43969]
MPIPINRISSILPIRVLNIDMIIYPDAIIYAVLMITGQSQWALPY